MSSIVLVTPGTTLKVTVVLGLDNDQQKNIFLRELERLSYATARDLQPMFFTEGHKPGPDLGDDFLETTPLEMVKAGRESNQKLIDALANNKLDEHCAMVEVVDGVMKPLVYSELPPEMQAAAKRELTGIIRQRTQLLNHLQHTFEEAELL